MDSGSAQQLGLMGQKVIESDVFVGIVFSAGCDDARRRAERLPGVSSVSLGGLSQYFYFVCGDGPVVLDLSEVLAGELVVHRPVLVVRDVV